MLTEASERYYENGTSILSDAEYDYLKDELRKIDPTNPLLMKVGSDEKIHFEKYDHGKYPMGSLSKVNTEADMRQWAVTQQYVVEQKLDGISLKLVYRNGKLSNAVTRGNGLIGDEIIRNVQKMKGVPYIIDTEETVIIRAEIVMTYKDFNSLEGEDKKKNPRNAAAGIAKRLDGSNCELLTVICTGIMTSNKAKSDDSKWLKANGFNAVEQTVVIGADAIINIYNMYVESKRDKLEYDIDGLVIKSIMPQNTGDWRYPTDCIAFKFPNKEAVTTLVGVEWNYEGSRISPIAILHPVNLMGVTISRATLNNIEFIREMGLKIGDTVKLVRANDVIPLITGVDEHRGIVEIKVPATCPTCGSPTVIDRKFVFCSNENCDSKVIRKIMKWFEAHDSKGIAEETVTKIYEAGMFQDLFSFLNIATLAGTVGFEPNVEGIGDKKWKLLKTEIEKTLKTDVVTFFDGLGFSDVGRKRIEAIYTVAKNNGFNSVPDFVTFLLTYDLTAISGIGSEISANIKTQVKKNGTLIHQLLEMVKIKSPAEPTGSSLGGKSFCFTGALNTMKRTEAEELVVKNGGTVKSVTKGLTYLVTNDKNSGSSKNVKAQSLGVTIIDENEFLAMI